MPIVPYIATEEVGTPVLERMAAEFDLPILTG